MEHQAAFITIFGKPNAGKSTFVNSIMEEHFAIVSHKVQTTRHRIRAILNDDNYQLIFSDTPGILSPKYKLQETMSTAIDESLDDADILLLMHDQADNEIDETILKHLNAYKGKKIMVLNKCDLITQDQIYEKTHFWKQSGLFYAVVPFSSLKPFNKPQLISFLLELTPEHPPYFDKEDISDKNVRFFISELIREQILNNYQKEIPYSTEVVIDEYIDGETLVKIHATIYVERESQRVILLGKAGLSLKKTVTFARKGMEQFLGKKVFLKTFIKVKENWRNNDADLKRFGYIE